MQERTREIEFLNCSVFFGQPDQYGLDQIAEDLSLVEVITYDVRVKRLRVSKIWLQLNDIFS